MYLRAIYERQVAKTSLSRRIVDEKDIERLSVNSNRALMIFQDQTNTPTPEPLVDTGDQGNFFLVTVSSSKHLS